MHGRNSEAWNKRVKTADERFDYLYSADELREWVPRVRGMAKDAREVHVLINNCHRDYGVRNAREIGEMLGAFRRQGQGAANPGATEAAVADPAH